MRAALSSIVREPLNWAMLAIVGIGGFVSYAVLAAPATQAAPPIGDTVVNVERWVNPNGDRLAAIRPDGWAQPVYFIWLSQECAATVRLGDICPSNSQACAVTR